MFKILKHWIDTERQMPMDQLQLQAASERLNVRTKQVREESDRLSEMIKRLKEPTKKECKK